MEHDLIKRIENINVYIGKRDADYTIQPHHYHNWYELFMVTDGECDFHVYDKSFKAVKGSVMLFRPGVFHYYTSKKGCEYVVTEITAGYISRFFTDEAANMLVDCFKSEIIQLDEHEFLDCLCYATIAENNSPKSVSDKFLAIGNLLNLLSEKSSHNINVSPLENVHKSSIEKLNCITDYITSHYAEIHSISDITRNCYISKSHMFRLFHQELGLSVSDYVNNLKIDAACKLLTTTELSVLNIAFESGFNSPQHFYKIFKKCIGCSPREYIKNFENR
jgi:AraC family transcriptional activator of mtrCDE